jgi:hypothetical protein
LNCSKRHKERAQCSGVRDSTSYIKKSDLRKPAAFDQDFNFISGLERAIDQAEDDLDSRLLNSSNPNRGSQFWSRVEEMRLFIHQAPEGMSRRKLNRSRWARQ